MTAEEDYKLMQYGIGFTNMVQRPTKGSADLTRKEIKEGSRILLDKIRKFQPKIAVFNGKLIFEVFSGKKDFCFGKQPETVEGTNTVSINECHRIGEQSIYFKTFLVYVGNAVIKCSMCAITKSS